jgi:hypothetical protein
MHFYVELNPLIHQHLGRLPIASKTESQVASFPFYAYRIGKSIALNYGSKSAELIWVMDGVIEIPFSNIAPSNGQNCFTTKEKTEETQSFLHRQARYNSRNIIHAST